MKTAFIVSNLSKYPTIENLINKRKKISYSERYSFALKLNRDDLPDIEEDISPPEVNDDSKKDGTIHKPKRGRPPKALEQTPPSGISPPDNSQLVKSEKLNKVALSENNSTEKTAIQQSKASKVMTKRDIIRKKLSAKKSRVKNKVFSALDLIQKLQKQSLPSVIKTAIVNSKFSVNRLTDLEQRSCFNFFDKLSKEEIALILLLAPSSAVELAFVKEVLLNRKSIDNLFRDFEVRNLT